MRVCALFQGQDGRDGYGPVGPKGVKVGETDANELALSLAFE